MWIDWKITKVRPLIAGRWVWERDVTVSRTYDARKPRRAQTLLQVFTGRGEAAMQTGRTNLKRGVCLWMRPGRYYDLRQDPCDPLGMTFIHFDLMTPAGDLRNPVADLPPEVLFPANPAMCELVAQRVSDLFTGGGLGVAHVPQPGPVLTTATALLTGVLIDLDHGASAATAARLLPGATGLRLKQQEQIRSLVTELADHPDNLPTVTEMARRLGYTRSHFSRVFRAAVGISARDFAIQTRIVRASYLLQHSSLTIGEIADGLGYRNIYQFSRQFRQKTKLTPTEHRQRGKKRGE